MTEVKAARAVYLQAQEESKALLAYARARLGKAIHDARNQDKTQEEIAKELGLSTELLRRVQREYELIAPRFSAVEAELTERILVVLGPPGAGKTTLLRRLAERLAADDSDPA